MSRNLLLASTTFLVARETQTAATELVAHETATTVLVARETATTVLVAREKAATVFVVVRQ
jgi:hypothetical protein